jgi:hypothetical protein
VIVFCSCPMMQAVKSISIMAGASILKMVIFSKSILCCFFVNEKFSGKNSRKAEMVIVGIKVKEK